MPKANDLPKIDEYLKRFIPSYQIHELIHPLE